MWRWIIRAYVSLMIFLFLLFVFVVGFKEIAHVFTRAGFPWLSEWFSAHALWTAFLVGIVAGQVSVDSRLTGEGWFRSKDGKSFEGFKLEQLRPWTWLMVSPILILGVLVWCFEQNQSVLSGPTLASFYHDLIMRNCSVAWTRRYWFDNSCNVQMLFIASWIASLGYSVAQAIRRRSSRIVNKFRGPNDLGDLQKESRMNLKKADS
jgi:hypothetical protein